MNVANQESPEVSRGLVLGVKSERYVCEFEQLLVYVCFACFGNDTVYHP